MQGFFFLPMGITSLRAHPQCRKFRMVIGQVVYIEFFLRKPGSWGGGWGLEGCWGVGWEWGLEGCWVLQPGVHIAPFSLEKGSEGKTDLTHMTQKQKDKQKRDLFDFTILWSLPECLFSKCNKVQLRIITHKLHRYIILRADF